MSVHESDDAVLRYMRSHPGAVGYVSERAEVADVKVSSVLLTYRNRRSRPRSVAGDGAFAVAQEA